MNKLGNISEMATACVVRPVQIEGRMPNNTTTEIGPVVFGNYVEVPWCLLAEDTMSRLHFSGRYKPSD